MFLVLAFYMSGMEPSYWGVVSQQCWPRSRTLCIENYSLVYHYCNNLRSFLLPTSSWWCKKSGFLLLCIQCLCPKYRIMLTLKYITLYKKGRTKLCSESLKLRWSYVWLIASLYCRLHWNRSLSGLYWICMYLFLSCGFTNQTHFCSKGLLNQRCYWKNEQIYYVHFILLYYLICLETNQILAQV